MFNPNYTYVYVCMWVCWWVQKKDWKEIQQNQGIVAGFCFNFIPFHIFQIFYHDSYCFYNHKISSKLNANSFLISSWICFYGHHFSGVWKAAGCEAQMKFPIPAGLSVPLGPEEKPSLHPCWQPAVHSCSEEAANEWSWWKNTTRLTLQGWHYAWNSCSPRK